MDCFCGLHIYKYVVNKKRLASWMLSFSDLTADLKLKLDFLPFLAIIHGVTKQHHLHVIDGAECTQILLTGTGITALFNR